MIVVYVEPLEDGFLWAKNGPISDMDCIFERLKIRAKQININPDNVIIGEQYRGSDTVMIFRYDRDAVHFRLYYSKDIALIPVWTEEK